METEERLVNQFFLMENKEVGGGGKGVGKR